MFRTKLACGCHVFNSSCEHEMECMYWNENRYTQRDLHEEEVGYVMKIVRKR